MIDFLTDKREQARGSLHLLHQFDAMRDLSSQVSLPVAWELFGNYCELFYIYYWIMFFSFTIILSMELLSSSFYDSASQPWFNSVRQQQHLEEAFKHEESCISLRSCSLSSLRYFEIYLKGLGWPCRAWGVTSFLDSCNTLLLFHGSLIYASKTNGRKGDWVLLNPDWM